MGERRKIVLELGAETTATHCEDCRSNDDGRCMALLDKWRGHDNQDQDDDGLLRTPRCLAAEAAASRLVSISPEDAAGWFAAEMTCGQPAVNESEAWDRVDRALAEHAKKGAGR